MNYDCIKNITRPNLYLLSEKHLLEIINKYDDLWYNKSQSRNDMIEKIFNLWSKYNIIDDNGFEIECLICWEKLTNGDNMTFTCGHKFHSKCIIKSILISSIDCSINFIKDNEKKEINVDYNCPQCKNNIETVNFNKNSYNVLDSL